MPSADAPRRAPGSTARDAPPADPVTYRHLSSIRRAIHAAILTSHDPRGLRSNRYKRPKSAGRDDSGAAFVGDEWRDTVGWSDEGCAADRADRIDILTDLSLHMAHNRLRVFARRPAPVQVTYLGYARNSGMRADGRRLSDAHLDPPGNDRVLYRTNRCGWARSYVLSAAAFAAKRSARCCSRGWADQFASTIT